MLFASALYFIISLIGFIIYKIKDIEGNVFHNLYIKFRKYLIGSILSLLIVMMLIFCFVRTFPDNTEIVT